MRQLCQCIHFIWDNCYQQCHKNHLCTIHINGICPWTLYMYVPLYCYCSLHLEHHFRYPLKTAKYSFNFQSNAIHMQVTNMPLKCHICHMCKVLDVHLWGKHAKIYATYWVAPISDVAKSAVHIGQQMMTCQQQWQWLYSPIA